jgi:nanoRNase/pAp phosphatase (c-di-AMP/oligoRNAs hydrolase)
MNQELTPKQQASELIKQAENIVIVTSREPSNDQLSAAVAMQRVLNKLHKQASVVITDKLPKSADLYDTQFISKEIQGVRDFVISVDMHDVVVDKLKYNVEGDRLDVTVTPLNGNFTAKDVSFEHGPFKFDLVIALGVPQILKLDKIVEQNPTIFDGLHLINVDYHRINEEYGSVNYIDQNASSVCEMLVSLFESLEQGIIDESIATALYTGITSATHNFTIPSTTAKAMTVAAQMLAAGAKQQEVVKVMNSKPKEAKPEKVEEVKVPDAKAPTSIKEAMEKAKKEATQEVAAEEPAKKEASAEGSKKKTKSGQKVNSSKKDSSQDPSKAKSDPKAPKSPLEN